MVRIQAQTTLLATPQRTAVTRFSVPTPTMAPVMVFDKEGRLILVVGSPGGARIIAYVARTLIRVLDGGMDIAAAVARPHVATTGTVAELERQLPGHAPRPWRQSSGGRSGGSPGRTIVGRACPW